MSTLAEQQVTEWRQRVERARMEFAAVSGEIAAHLPCIDPNTNDDLKSLSDDLGDATTYARFAGRTIERLEMKARHAQRGAA